MPKNLLLTLAFCAAVLFQSFIVKSDAKIKFRDGSWNEITKDAKSEEKLIFVLVTADWCNVCKRMEKVLEDNKLGEFYNQNFVNTRFDSDNTMQQFRASNWGVSRVPAMVYLDQRKRVVHTASGYRDQAGMIAEAKKALKAKK